MDDCHTLDISLSGDRREVLEWWCNGVASVIEGLRDVGIDGEGEGKGEM